MKSERYFWGAKEPSLCAGTLTHTHSPHCLSLILLTYRTGLVNNTLAGEERPPLHISLTKTHLINMISSCALVNVSWHLNDVWYREIYSMMMCNPKKPMSFYCNKHFWSNVIHYFLSTVLDFLNLKYYTFLTGLPNRNKNLTLSGFRRFSLTQG